jgi:hypothetical protein
MSWNVVLHIRTMHPYTRYIFERSSASSQTQYVKSLEGRTGPKIVYYVFEIELDVSKTVLLNIPCDLLPGEGFSIG